MKNVMILILDVFYKNAAGIEEKILLKRKVAGLKVSREESVEHKHEWVVTFKDGRAYIKCTICGTMKLHELEGGDALRKEKKTER